MALVLDQNLISKEFLDKIKLLLNVVAEEHKNRKNFKNKFQKPPRVVRAYQQLIDAAAQKIFLRIPLFFGTSTFKQSNDSRNFGSSNFAFSGTLRPYQISVVYESIRNLTETRGDLIKIRPGRGKTVCSLAIASMTGLLTLILVPGKQLGMQWLESCANFTNAKVWVVGEVFPPEGYCDIIISIPQRVKKIPKDILEKVGFLVIDEAHMFCNDTGMSAILSVQPRMVLGCTATFNRSRDKLHILMEMILGYRHVTLLNDKIEFSTIAYYTDYVGIREQNKQGILDWTKLYQSLIFNEQRNWEIVMLTWRMIMFNQKVMIVTNERKHVEILVELFGKIQVKVATLYGDQNSYEDAPVLIGIIKKCGTGFDEANTCSNFTKLTRRINTVLFAVSVANEELFEQIAGRAFRDDYPLIFYMVDNDSNIRGKHWSKCKKWCVNNGGTVAIMRKNDLFTPELQFVQQCIIDGLLQHCYSKRIEAAAAMAARMALIQVLTYNMQTKGYLEPVPVSVSTPTASSSQDTVIIEF